MIILSLGNPASMSCTIKPCNSKADIGVLKSKPSMAGSIVKNALNLAVTILYKSYRNKYIHHLNKNAIST